MEQKLTSRRSFLSLAALVPIAAYGLTACGSSGPGDTSAGGATIWALSGQPNEAIRQKTIDVFNSSNPDEKINVTFFQNDAYKTKRSEERRVGKECPV